MSNNQNVACPTITRFQLWDPQFLKKLVSDLCIHLAHALEYTQNEDDVFQLLCAHRKCPKNHDDCWDVFETFFSERGLEWETVREHLNDNLGLMTGCQRDLLRRYHIAEVTWLFEQVIKTTQEKGDNNGNTCSFENNHLE